MTTSDQGVRTARASAARSGTRADRRAALLDRLCRLFLAEGFAHFTLDDLARQLHCSKSTLYTLAGSKEQLAVRVVGHFFKTATAEIERAVAAETDVRERMRRYLQAAAEHLRPASRQFIDDMAANPATRASYEANARAGMANKVGARFAERVLTATPDSGLAMGRPIGIPLRESITGLDRMSLRAQARKFFGLHPHAPTILVFGGSQGAQTLNTAFSGAAQALGRAGVGVLHAHG